MGQYGKRKFPNVDEKELEPQEHFNLHDALMKHQKDPDYVAVVQVATHATFEHLSGISFVILFVPLFTGLLFGKSTLCCLVIGMMIAGIPMSISAASSGSLWKGAKLLLKDEGYDEALGWFESKAE